MTLPQGYRFASLAELWEKVRETPEGEPLGMDRLQYAEYKRLVWEWMATRPDPIMEYAGHKIEVVARGE